MVKPQGSEGSIRSPKHEPPKRKQRTVGPFATVVSFFHGEIPFRNGGFLARLYLSEKRQAEAAEFDVEPALGKHQATTSSLFVCLWLRQGYRTFQQELTMMYHLIGAREFGHWFIFSREQREM